MSTEQKCADYGRMAEKMAPRWQHDLWLLDHAPVRWQQIRDMDDALVSARDDDAFSVGAYRRQCLALRELFERKTI